MFSAGTSARVAVRTTRGGVLLTGAGTGKADYGLHLDGRQPPARRQVVAREEAGAGRTIDRGHPEDTAVDVDALHMMRRRLDQRDADEGQGRQQRGAMGRPRRFRSPCAT